MAKYITKRILGMIPLLIGISFITYLLIFLSPGGPTTFMSDFNPKVSQEVREKMIKLYDLDKPLHIQYIKWLSKLARLNFGQSLKDNRPVTEIILERLPRTLLLSVSSILLTFLLAIPIGIFSALKQNSLWDRSFTVFVFIGYAVPFYWFALLLMIGVGIHLGWLPVTGFRSINFEDLSWMQQRLDYMTHLALPLIAISLTSLASLSRYMRNGMLEVIRQDYIKTARAKGLSEKRVILVHALRNTLIPIVTILGLTLPSLISNGVIIETIFSYPGLGRLMFEAVMSRNIPVIMASVTVSAFLTLLGNFLADISYAYVDPRIRYR